MANCGMGMFAPAMPLPDTAPPPTRPAQWKIVGGFRWLELVHRTVPGLAVELQLKAVRQQSGEHLALFGIGRGFGIGRVGMAGGRRGRRLGLEVEAIHLDPVRAA